MGINSRKEKPGIGRYIFAALFVVGLIAGTAEFMNMLDRAAHHIEARK